VKVHSHPQFRAERVEGFECATGEEDAAHPLLLEVHHREGGRKAPETQHSHYKTVGVVTIPGIEVVTIPGIGVVTIPGIGLVSIPGIEVVTIPGIGVVTIPGIGLVSIHGTGEIFKLYEW